MSMPAYYTPPRVPSWLWVTLAITAALAALLFGARSWLSLHDDGQRRAIYAEAAQWERVTTTLTVAAWRRERDSLRVQLGVQQGRAVASRDTARVALLELERAITRANVAQLTPRVDATPIASAPDSSLTQSATRAVRACTAALNDCDVFRATATRSLWLADSLHTTDSLAHRSLSIATALQHDSLSAARASLSHRPTWRAAVGATITGVAVGVVLCAVVCR